MSKQRHTIGLVVLDLAGTIIDHGCFGPVAPFITVFREEGIDVTAEQARVPMGLHKRDHIQAMAAIPEVAEQWRRRKGAPFSDADLDRMYHAFVDFQLAELQHHSKLITGVTQCIAQLREQGIRVVTTTGYFRQAAELVQESLLQQGFHADHSVCAEDVPKGRPAPWMIFTGMQAVGIYPPCSVLKLGDTVPDIEAGRNAGCWSVGVTGSSSFVGLSEAELAAKTPEERTGLLLAAREAFEQAGAHATIDCISELPELIETINQQLLDGIKP